MKSKSAKKPGGCMKVLKIFLLSFVVVFFGIPFIIAIITTSIHYIGAEGELAKADELWTSGNKSNAVEIYVSHIEFVDKENLPKTYKRIISHNVDSGEPGQAKDFMKKALEEELEIIFQREDLQKAYGEVKEEIELKRAAVIAKREKIARERDEMLKSNLDRYLLWLNDARIASVEHVYVESDGDIWTATLKVNNYWHIKPYQVRLQDAQNLWKLWAITSSPANRDLARIKIVDLNGNEVGGSRILAGSLIWVQER